MKNVQFAKITTIERLEKEGAYKVCSSKDTHEPKYLKGRICIIFTDVYGVFYIKEVTKLIRKYTCGQLLSRKMVENISRSLEQMEFFLEEDGQEGYILELEKSLKQAGRDNGYA